MRLRHPVRATQPHFNAGSPLQPPDGLNYFMAAMKASTDFVSASAGAGK